MRVRGGARRRKAAIITDHLTARPRARSAGRSVGLAVAGGAHEQPNRGGKHAQHACKQYA